MKIYPYYMNLGTSGVIWGTFGVILECRITVCNYSIETSIQKSQPSTLINCVHSVVTRFEPHFSQLCPPHPYARIPLWEESKGASQMLFGGFFP